MLATKLDGPFRLTFDDVRNAAGGGHCGVYVLGSLRADGLFAVSYVGASYDQLGGDLCDRIGTAPYFKLKILLDQENTFLHLCELFHTLRPSGNYVHPERPKQSRIGCPFCAPARLRDAPAGGYR